MLIHRLSFSRILTISPKSISKPSPKEESSNSGVYSSPNNSPEAPKSCKTMVSNPSFSSPNLLNSLFI